MYFTFSSINLTTKLLRPDVDFPSCVKYHLHQWLAALGPHWKQITHKVSLRHIFKFILGGYNHFLSRMIFLQDVEPPLNSRVYTLYCHPQCRCSCLKSVAITVIWVALTASQVWAAITSLSFPLAALFSPNLLHAVWLAVKWRFLFSFEVPTGLGNRGDGPY